ncbi:MAG: DNA internalization-related competence protein ComEC/Rec2, partial [Lachnospiraceae bacterium]
IALSLGMLLVVRPAPIFEINVLDVGQGDGILVQSETGEGYFIDGGSSDVKKVGTYRILPFLKYKGISKITCWMVSHADSDHISGLQEILEAGYPIENLVLSQYMVQDEAWKSLISLAEKRGCQVRYGKPGTKFGIGTTKFKIVYPLEGSGIDRNASSMVVLLKHQKFFGLFTGDIGELQEQELISYVNLRKEIGSGVSFYKAAHHGSNTSNCNAILEEINPVVSVISCGRGNHYGHPGKDAWNRIEAASQIVFCTMETGQITITHKEGKIQGKCFLKK